MVNMKKSHTATRTHHKRQKYADKKYVKMVPLNRHYLLKALGRDAMMAIFDLTVSGHYEWQTMSLLQPGISSLVVALLLATKLHDPVTDICSKN